MIHSFHLYVGDENSFYLREYDWLKLPSFKKRLIERKMNIEIKFGIDYSQWWCIYTRRMMLLAQQVMALSKKLKLKSMKVSYIAYITN